MHVWNEFQKILCEHTMNIQTIIHFVFLFVTFCVNCKFDSDILCHNVFLFCHCECYFSEIFHCLYLHSQCTWRKCLCGCIFDIFVKMHDVYASKVYDWQTYLTKLLQNAKMHNSFANIIVFYSNEYVHNLNSQLNCDWKAKYISL